MARTITKTLRSELLLLPSLVPFLPPAPSVVRSGVQSIAPCTDAALTSMLSTGDGEYFSVSFFFRAPQSLSVNGETACGSPFFRHLFFCVCICKLEDSLPNSVLSCTSWVLGKTQITRRGCRPHFLYPFLPEVFLIVYQGKIWENNNNNNKKKWTDKNLKAKIKTIMALTSFVLNQYLPIRRKVSKYSLMDHTWRRLNHKMDLVPTSLTDTYYREFSSYHLHCMLCSKCYFLKCSLQL